MGLFSGISKVLFGDTSRQIGQAGQQSLGFQRQGLDYLKGIDEPALAARGAALPLLQGFYTGDPGASQEILDRIQANPFYAESLRAGEESALSRAGPMGLTRSGNVAEDLFQSKQNVMQGFLQQQLGGLQGLANLPTQGANIASIYQGMGQTAGDVGTAQTQAEQSGIGQLLQTGLGIAGLFSDERLKEDIQFLGIEKGHKIYQWKWNDIAKELFDLEGEEVGVIAQEVEKYAPHLIDNSGYYKTVNYLGVAHG